MRTEKISYSFFKLYFFNNFLVCASISLIINYTINNFNLKLLITLETAIVTVKE